MNDHPNGLYRRLVTDENNEVRDRKIGFDFLFSTRATLGICVPFQTIWNYKLYIRAPPPFSLHRIWLLNTESALCRNVIPTYSSVNYEDTFPIESQVH